MVIVSCPTGKTVCEAFCFTLFYNIRSQVREVFIVVVAVYIDTHLLQKFIAHGEPERLKF